MYEIDLQAERFIAEGIGWNAVLGALEGMAEKRAQGVFKNPAAACLNAARLRQKGDWGWVKNLSKKSWGPYTGPGRQ
jgi:hypothetical protein